MIIMQRTKTIDELVEWQKKKLEEMFQDRDFATTKTH
jgi:hypothetical protein